MNEMLFDNPLLIKHIRSRLRRPQITYLLIVVCIICTFILWLGFAGIGFETGIPFALLFGLQGCALHLIGTSQVATSIGQVNDSGILDFHRIAPLPASTTALGFVLGAPIREYVVALVAMPFAFCAAILGNPGFVGFLTSTLVLFTTTWLFHLLAMMSGLLAPKGKTRGTNLAVGMFVILASLGSSWIFAGLPLPGMLTAGPALIEALGGLKAVPMGNLPTFFGLAFPMFVQTCCYQLPFIAFLLIAVVRRMRSGEAAVYSKSTAVAFLAAISVLNMGAIVGQPNIQANLIIIYLLYLNALVSLLLIGAITPDQGTFMNHLRRANKFRLIRPSLWSDEASNRSALILICGVTLAMVETVHSLAIPAQQAPIAMSHWIPTISTIMLVAYVGFAAQYLQISVGKKAKATLFVLLFGLWVIPLMVGSVFAMGAGNAAAGLIFGISPLIGIASSSGASLVINSVLAGFFFLLLIREESRAWMKVKTTSLQQDIDQSNYDPM